MPRMLCPVVIGRGEETSRVQRAVQLSLQRRGGVLLVCGAAGIGKSRLLADAEEEARRRDCIVLRGRAVPSEVPAPYRPLTEALLAKPLARACAL